MGRALIVSAGASSNEYLAQHIADCGYPKPAIVPSCSEARRLLAGTEYELVIINAPLPDEYGHELSIYAAENTLSGVLLLAKTANIEQIIARTEQAGVFVVSKPFTSALFRQGVLLAQASSRRLENLRLENDRLREKIEQIRLVDRAKCCLIETRGMKEAEAHRYIEKLAMDTRRSRSEIAEEILLGPDLTEE